MRKLFSDIRTVALPLLVSGGGLLGLVAFVGGALTWARFSTANLPAEQAIAAMPEGALVANGAASLTIFTLLGLLAVLVTYLISRRPERERERDERERERGMAYGLFVLLLAESAVVLIFAWEDVATMVSAGLVMFAWATVAILVIEELLVPLGGNIKAGTAEQDEDQDEAWASAERERRETYERRKPWYRCLIVLGVAVGIAPVFVTEEEWWVGLAMGSAALLAFTCVAIASTRVRRDGDSALPAGERARLATYRRRQLGYAISCVTAAAAGISAGVITGEWWVGVMLPLAGLLAFGCLRIFRVTGSEFAWYGVAVFFSVPIFGATFSIARALDEPQLQPIALIREGDGPGEGLQGIFVTENDDRVYLASIGRDACGSKHLLADSGRMFWVARDDVVTYALGPRQNADRAARSAPAMLATLIATRLDEEPEGKGGQRGVQEAREPEQDAARPLTLAPVAPAIRTQFEVESISPRRARVGQQVTVLGEGFGLRRGTVTVGGVSARYVRWFQNGGPNRTDRIEFKVPSEARTGRVVIGCHTPKPSPVLQVAGSRRAKRLTANARVQP